MAHRNRGLPFLTMVDLSMANCECHNQMVSLILYQLRKSPFLLADFNPHVFLVQLPIKLLKPRGWTDSTVSFDFFELYIGTIVKWWESITKMWTNSTVSCKFTFFWSKHPQTEFFENDFLKRLVVATHLQWHQQTSWSQTPPAQQKAEVWLNGSKFRNWCGGYHQTWWKFREILYFSQTTGESKQQNLFQSSGSRNRLTIKNSSWGSLMKAGIQRDEKT